MARNIIRFRTANIAALAVIPLLLIISGCTAASPSSSTALGEASSPPANELAFTIDPGSGIYVPCTSVIEGASLVLLEGGVQKTARDLKTGDVVMAAGPGLRWEARKLTMFDSVNEAGGATMIRIYYGQDQEMLLTPGSVLVKSDRVLVNVDKIVPGEKLLGADGGALSVSMVEMGLFSGTLIALSTDTPAGQGGTVFAINGLAVPEYLFQP